MLMIIDVLSRVLAIAFAMTIHEFVKASLSTKYGDSLPRTHGRLTLNPFKHLEPIGFICMYAFGFGWSKPTETNSTYYSDRNRHTLLTYVVPSVVNILLMVIFAMLYRIIFISYSDYLFSISSTVTLSNINTLSVMIPQLLRFISYLASYNFALALFNAIPVKPLDGAKVLALSLSPNELVKMSAYEKILQVILILLLATGILGYLFNPVMSTILQLLMGVQIR